jgi:hypothetical protein
LEFFAFAECTSESQRRILTKPCKPIVRKEDKALYVEICVVIKYFEEERQISNFSLVAEKNVIKVISRLPV